MKNTKEKSKLFLFFSKNFFNVGTIFWIIAIIITIYFSLEAKSERELKYYCHPVKATVVKTGQTSSLEVFCDDEKIESDVTAVQVAIWNNGPTNAVHHQGCLDAFTALQQQANVLSHSTVTTGFVANVIDVT